MHDKITKALRAAFANERDFKAKAAFTANKTQPFMLRLLVKFSIVLAACFCGCCGQPAHSELDRSDLFVTLEWHGPVTEPVLEVAFASKGKDTELKRWLASNRRTRSGSIISKESGIRLEALLEEKKFAARKTASRPSDDPQYVLTRHSFSGVSYFPLPLDASMTELLTELKSVLDTPSAALVERIIAGIPK